MNRNENRSAEMNQERWNCAKEKANSDINVRRNETYF